MLTRGVLTTALLVVALVGGPPALHAQNEPNRAQACQQAREEIGAGLRDTWDAHARLNGAWIDLQVTKQNNAAAAWVWVNAQMLNAAAGQLIFSDDTLRGLHLSVQKYQFEMVANEEAVKLSTLELWQGKLRLAEAMSRLQELEGK